MPNRQRTAVATTLLLRGFVPSCEVWSGPTSAKKAAVPHIHISKQCRRLPNPAPQRSGAATIVCSLGALAALREDLVWGGDGAFAPESWVPSARRPYPIFSIRVDSRHSRACLKRQRTAVATTLLLRGFVASCEVWSGPTSAKLTAGAFFPERCRRR